jgi:hypothetical protein
MQIVSRVVYVQQESVRYLAFNETHQEIWTKQISYNNGASYMLEMGG